tara:strand:- start:16461 stop:17003 length:543 start_codon:yes stop_codon:yes gene_type:complete
MTGVETALIVGGLTAAAGAVIQNEAQSAQNSKIAEAARRTRATNRALARSSASESRASVARKFDALAGTARVRSAATGTAGSRTSMDRVRSLFADTDRSIGSVDSNLFATNAAIDSRFYNAMLQQGSTGLASLQGGLQGLQLGLSLYGAVQDASGPPTPTTLPNSQQMSAMQMAAFSMGP